MANAYRYNRNRRIFPFTNYSFNIFITDIFGGLCAGAVLVPVELGTNHG